VAFAEGEGSAADQLRGGEAEIGLVADDGDGLSWDCGEVLDEGLEIEAGLEEAGHFNLIGWQVHFFGENRGGLPGANQRAGENGTDAAVTAGEVLAEGSKFGPAFGGERAVGIGPGGGACIGGDRMSDNPKSHRGRFQVCGERVCGMGLSSVRMRATSARGGAEQQDQLPGVAGHAEAVAGHPLDCAKEMRSIPEQEGGGEEQGEQCAQGIEQ
jgi:hypothetical protein